jgi:hypothetical protein
VIEGGDAVEAGEQRFPTIDTLAVLLEQVAVAQRRARYRESSQLLPTVLRGQHQAADFAGPGHERERAHALLAFAYSATLYCLHRLGSAVTGQAAERGAVAARNSGDPLLGAFAEANKGVPLLYRGSFPVAVRVVTRAGAAADAEPDTTHAFAVRGATHLQLAILAARTGHAATAEAHLGQARDLARWVPNLGPEADYYD